MTTKEQERKALEQIRKIVEGLGENSYVATAFEGCFEKAEENIEYDAAFSWKGEAECTEKKVKQLELENRDLRNAVAQAKANSSKQITALQLRIEELEKAFISADDLTDCIQLVTDAECEAAEGEAEAAKKIVLYAEAPADNEFLNAVRVNRAMASRREYLKALRSRLEKRA